jgi:dolichyl-phosphate beta-glucosyltransferase
VTGTTTPAAKQPDAGKTGMAADSGGDGSAERYRTGFRRYWPDRDRDRDWDWDWAALARTLAVPVGYLFASLLLYQHLWADLDRRYLVDSMRDQNQWEWFVAVTADHVLSLRDPLFTTLQNFPLGVNLMANTAMFGLSVPLAPVTALFGPTVTWAVVLTGGLAATATAWFWLIRKYLTGRRAAAALGGAFSAFAPPMISHANAHPNLVVLFVIPLIIDRLLRLSGVPAREGGRTGRTGAGRRGRVVRDGIVLGLLLVWQIFLGEEALLLAATGMLVFAVGCVSMRPATVRGAALPLLGGLAVAAAVCLPLIGYPLYWQFFGDQSYRSILHGPTGNTPLALVEFSGRALAGDPDTAAALSLNPTEQNAFYGWPLVSLLLGIAVVLWDRTVVRALTGTAVTAAVLSLGATFPLPWTDATAPGPWWFLDKLPLFESVIESRYAMVCAAPIGMLLALAWEHITEAARAARSGAPSHPKADRPAPAAGAAAGAGAKPGAAGIDGAGQGPEESAGAGPGDEESTAGGTATAGGAGDSDRGDPDRHDRDRRDRGIILRVAGGLALLAALLPIVPKPLETIDRPETPAFVADGTWRSYVEPGRSLVPVPLPDPGEASALKWQIDAKLGFPLPGGYFNGPWGPDRIGIYGAVPRPTNDLLREVRYSGRIPVVGPEQQQAARDDLAFWRAGAVVLAGQPHDEALRITLERLLGEPGERIGDVWVWDVQPSTSRP